MATVATAPPEPGLGYKQELARTLNVSDLIIYGMLYMLPIAPFAVYGIISDTTHGMVPLAYSLAIVAMLFTARSYVVFSTAFPVAGSSYTYARMGLGEVAGFFAGWLVFLDYIIAPGLLAIVSAAAMNAVVPAVPRWAWIAGFLGLGALMNFVGVNLTAKTNRVMLYLSLAVLATFLAAGLYALYGLHRGNGGLTIGAFYDRHLFTWAGMTTGVLIASSNFLGFDAITTLGEEIREDQKHRMGFAGMFTLAAIAVMFILQTWVAADLAPGAVTKSADTAFYDIARYAGGDGLSAMTSIATALAWGIPCTIVCQSSITRIIYAMARDRQLPGIFARVHARTRQPYVANLFVSAVSLLIALAFQSRLDELILFQNFGALSAFTLVNLAVVNYFWRGQRSGDALNHVILPLLGAAVSLFLMSAMRDATVALGGFWLTLGLAYYLTLRFVLKRSIALVV